MANAPDIPWEIFDLWGYYGAARVFYEFKFRNPSPCRVRFRIGNVDRILPPIGTAPIPHSSANLIPPPPLRFTDPQVQNLTHFDLAPGEALGNNELVVTLITADTQEVKAQASRTLRLG